MEALFSILTLFIFLGAGLAAAQIRPVRENPLTERFSSWILYALLFFMGFRIAAGAGSERLVEIGRLSIAFALSTVAGTVIVLYVIYTAAALSRRKAPATAGADAERPGFFRMERSPDGGLSHFAAFGEPLKLLLIVVAGFFCGWLIKIPGFTGEKISGWMLRFLLFAIGIDMIKGGINLKNTLVHPETLYLPAGVIAGSLLGGLIPAVIFSIEPGKALAVASGFGWYSLSGVLIADMGDPVLGSAAFMSNILRETIALLSIPLISRTRFPHIGIGVAGATSMDVSLPLVEKCCGPESVPVSVASGALLSLLVPVLVPLFFQL